MVTKVSKPGPALIRAKIIANRVGNLTPDFLGFCVAPAGLTRG
jgi:hypothetical protein